jgi:hypothetical protein
MSDGIGFLLICSFAFGVVYFLIAVQELRCQSKLLERIEALEREVFETRK